MQILIALSLLVLGGSLMLLRPFALFPLLLVVSPIFDISIRVGPVAVHPSNILLLALCGGVLIHRLRTETLVVGRPQLLAVTIGTWILFAGLVNRGPGTLKRILAMGLMYCAFEATMQSIRSVKDLLNLRHWIAISGALAAATGWLLRSSVQFNGRAAGVFGNPNGLGMFLAGCIPMTFSLIFQARNPWQRRYSVLAFLVSSSGLWISGSRGALVGAVCACVFIGSRHLRQVVAAGLILGGGLFLLTIVEESNHGFERMPTAAAIAPVIFENSKVWLALNGFEQVSFWAPPWVAPRDLERFPQSLGARMMIWYQAVRLGLANPVAGIGTGNSRFAAIPFDSKVFNNCFNIYLASFVEGGLLGLLLHILWIRVLARTILSSLVNPDPERIRGAAAGSTLAFMIHGLVEDTYFAIYPNWLIGIVFAMTIRAQQLPAQVPDSATAPCESEESGRYIAEGPPNS